MPTFTNALNPVEVSVAIERLLIAPYPASFTPARVDLASLPNGFFDLGAVVEDSPSFSITREKFQINTGIPMVLQYESILGMSGTLSATLRSNSWRKLQVALGNFTAVSSATSVTNLSSTAPKGGGSFTIATTTASLCVGKQVVIVPDAGNPDTIDAFETRITSITANGLTFAVDPVMPTTFASGADVYIYTHVTQVFGGRQIRYYTVLGVADFIDGTQIVHEVMKASPAAEFTEEIRPNQEGRIPLTFNMLGVEATVNSCTELLVAKRHSFPKGCSSC